jgi:Domain of unknown function (DUF4157)
MRTRVTGEPERKKAAVTRPPARPVPGLSTLRRGGGSPLPEGIGDRLGGALGVDLSRVRVHTDEAAAEASRAVSARAFTLGQDIYFARGRYDPSSPDGQRLLAHEIMHTRQQPSAANGAQAVSAPGDAAEREADVAADAFMAGAAMPRPGAAPEGMLLRDPDPQRRGDAYRPKPLRLFPEGLGLPRQNDQVLFTEDQLNALVRAPLPPNVNLEPIPGEPGKDSKSPPDVKLDSSVNLPIGNPRSPTPALEVSVSLFVDYDALKKGPVDLFHQPTAQITLGVPLNGPLSSYMAAQLSVTLLNLHLKRLSTRDLLELAVGQVGVSVQDGQGSVSIGSQLEAHITNRASLTLTGGVTFIRAGNGIVALPVFTPGFLGHVAF